MTARFDAFKQALEALCVTHGVTLSADYSGYIYADISDGTDLDLHDGITPRVAQDARKATGWDFVFHAHLIDAKGGVTVIEATGRRSHGVLLSPTDIEHDGQIYARIEQPMRKLDAEFRVAYVISGVGVERARELCILSGLF